jgi:hypothetical protein
LSDQQSAEKILCEYCAALAESSGKPVKRLRSLECMLSTPMKHIPSKYLAAALIAPTVLAQAQVFQVEKPAPEFALTIRQVGYGGSLPGYYSVLVTERNISDTEMVRWACMALEDGLDLVVAYEGVRMPETDAVRRLEQRRKAGGPCGVDSGTYRIAPGKDYLFQLNITDFYDMSRPGTYKITVTKDTAPGNPVMNTVVESNAIMIMVPKATTKGSR